MAELNGSQSLQQLAGEEAGDYSARDAARIAAREPLPEVPPATADPIGMDIDVADKAFNQHQHDAILAGLDSYADAYNGRLASMSKLNARLSDDMLKQVAKVKETITTMWLLGAAIDNKERNDTAFVEKSERELERMGHPS